MKTLKQLLQVRVPYWGMMLAFMARLFDVPSHAAEPTAPSAGAPLPWPKPGKVIRLWPGDAPGLVTPAKAEEIVNERIRNISVPELWVFLPEREGHKRAALLICPGGGYGHLAMGLHVGNVVKLFNDQGVVVFGLKYRTKYGANSVADDAVADCARAVRLIRQQSDSLGVDPGRVGVQGYSAGGNIGLNLLGRFDGGDANSEDPVQRFSSRPDFMALMCPWPNGQPIANYSVNPNPPPVFIASAEDDKTAPTTFALEIAAAVKSAGGEVRMFVVPTGGHGAFHYGEGNGPGTKWPEAFRPLLERR